jgi:hypothetical protein
MKKTYIIIFILLLTFIPFNIKSQDASITLRNNQVIDGKIIEENSDSLLLESEMGQIKISRKNIRSLIYKYDSTDSKVSDNSSETATLIEDNSYKKINTLTQKELVVIYFKNGEVFSGALLAKSLNIIIIQTESGKLTVNKKEIKKIEYISSEYAERGETVVVHLITGEKFEGIIYFEDSKELLIQTKLGKLALPKNILRSIEYKSKPKNDNQEFSNNNENISKNVSKQEIEALNGKKKIKKKRVLLSRYDVIDINYSTGFGPDFGSGFGLGYHNMFTIAQLSGLDISAFGGITFTYFKLSDEVAQKYPSISGNYKGGAFATTIAFGGSMSIYPWVRFNLYPNSYNFL